MNKLGNLVFILIICISLCGCNKKGEIKIVKEEKIENTDIVENSSISLIAVGDALIHDAVYNDAKTSSIGTDGYNIYNFKPMFTYLKDIVKDYDLKFYNQETIIGGKGLGLSNYPRFNSPDEIGIDMIDTGFNIVNLATNHTLDKGEEAILYSDSFWKKQEGIFTVGSYSSFEDRNKIRIQSKNGIKYTVLGYTTTTNGIPIPSGKDYLVNVYDKEKVKQDIERVKDYVDVIIVSMHWGIEYTHTPTSEQREIAAYLSSLGVNVIIGTHPHVVEPIEYIDNTLVIYSLGNLISAQNGTDKLIGMVAGLTINKNSINGESTITVDNVKADLLYTSYNSRYRDYHILPFTAVNDSILNNYKSIYDDYTAYINSTNDSRIKTKFLTEG